MVQIPAPHHAAVAWRTLAGVAASPATPEDQPLLLPLRASERRELPTAWNATPSIKPMPTFDDDFATENNNKDLHRYTVLCKVPN